MNKYELRAEQQRKAALRFSMMLWTAGLGLIVVVLTIVGLNNSAPRGYFSKTAIGLAVLLLLLRQMTRRLKGRSPRAAQPDPKSQLKLD
ncbi:MAG: hypothetical protein JO145_09615 [Acidobacteriaceae bacterium]|nr:hypothetical protein [Acidobacteriaceae bacterium]MBV9765178.1 hypothetical protein [Acidobacteriaceae bacterium]